MDNESSLDEAVGDTKVVIRNRKPNKYINYKGQK